MNSALSGKVCWQEGDASCQMPVIAGSCIAACCVPPLQETDVFFDQFEELCCQESVGILLKKIDKKKERCRLCSLRRRGGEGRRGEHSSSHLQSV